MNPIDTVQIDGKRGKEWSVITKKNQNNFSFITVLYPYIGYSTRIDETNEMTKIKHWVVKKSPKINGIESVSLLNNNKELFFNVKEVFFKDEKIEFTQFSDVYVSLIKDKISIQNIGVADIKVKLKNNIFQNVKPGDVVFF